MALFRDFSFDKPAQVDHEADRSNMNCSPTSLPSPPPTTSARQPAFPHPGRPLTPPPCTVGDLAQILNQHCLAIDTSLSNSHCSSAADAGAAPPTPPSDCDEPPPRPTYSRISTSVLRMQRQTNSRLQCCTAQANRISHLVRMVERGDQCFVSAPPAAAMHVDVDADAQDESNDADYADADADADDDEAIDMDFECTAPSPSSTSPDRRNAAVPLQSLFSQPLWRAADCRENCVRVTKNVRMRRRSKDKDAARRVR